MIRRISNLPSLSAIRPPSAYSLIDDDLIEMSLSGSPAGVFNVSGEAGVRFSDTGWASSKIPFSYFADSVVSATSGLIVEQVSGSILDIVSGNIFTTSVIGTFSSTGGFLEIVVAGEKKYIPLYNKV